MRTAGSCVPAPRSTVDHGAPLPKHTSSGRDIWSAYEQQGTRVSPVQIQPLTLAETVDLTERSAKAAQPGRRPRTPKPGPTGGGGGRLGLDTALIATLYATGLTPTQIARQFGCAPNSIRHQLKKAGVSIRDERKSGARRAPRSPVAKDVEEMVRARAAGETFASIAARLDHTTRTVRRHVAKANEGQAA